MACAARVWLRLAVAFLFLLAAFYVGRPLYWKLSATIHEVREKRKSVKDGGDLPFRDPSLNVCFWGIRTVSIEIKDLPHGGSGISQFVLEAQKSVGWVHDESDSGAGDDRKASTATSRRILRYRLATPLLHDVI